VEDVPERDEVEVETDLVVLEEWLLLVVVLPGRELVVVLVVLRVFFPPT